MSIAIEILQELLDGGYEGIYTLMVGKLENLGGIPAAEFRYTDSGMAMFRGNLKAESLVTKANGDTFIVTRNMPIVAWDDVAEEMMELELKQGDSLVIVGEYLMRKGRDDRYYPEVRVIYSEKS